MLSNCAHAARITALRVSPVESETRCTLKYVSSVIPGLCVSVRFGRAGFEPVYPIPLGVDCGQARATKAHTTRSHGESQVESLKKTHDFGAHESALKDSTLFKTLLTKVLTRG